MKFLFVLILTLFLFACTSSKQTYWCGDHACINNKEKESYFKKTMIVEVRNLEKKKRVIKKIMKHLELIHLVIGLVFIKKQILMNSESLLIH